MVTFYDVDFGETYRAGVAEIYESDADLDTSAKASAITRKHQIGLPIELVEEHFFLHSPAGQVETEAASL